MHRREALDEKLTNSGKEIDFDNWRKGCKKFATDNDDVLRTFVSL